RPIELHRHSHRRVERSQRVPPRRPRTTTRTLTDRRQQPRITHQHRRPKPRHPPQQRPRRDHPHTHPTPRTPHQPSNTQDLPQRTTQQRTRPPPLQLRQPTPHPTHRPRRRRQPATVRHHDPPHPTRHRTHRIQHHRRSLGRDLITPKPRSRGIHVRTQRHNL